MAIVDDSPFVRSGGSVYPVSATFHRFAAAVVREGGLDRATYLVPVRDAPAGASHPDQAPVDERWLRVVPTAPFSGIAGYLQRLPWMIRDNAAVFSRAIAGADLCWIKAPASNAGLAALACASAGTPRFTYIVGSARAVVRAQARTGAQSVAAAVAATIYDGVTRLLQATGPSLTLSGDLFTSIVTAADIEATTDRAEVPEAGRPFRLVWAGRVAAEKGLSDLFEALRRLRADGLDVRLDLIGDGPHRSALERSAAELRLGDAVRWRGFIGDRTAYFAALREGHLFVFPSRAEGLPKAVVEAMAVGLPVVATTAGAAAEVVGPDRGRLVPPSAPDVLARAIRELADDEQARARFRAAGLAWAADRTIDAQARRLVEWLRERFPELPWERPGGS